jgi:hypothetical protein
MLNQLSHADNVAEYERTLQTVEQQVQQTFPDSTLNFHPQCKAPVLPCYPCIIATLLYMYATIEL